KDINTAKLIVDAAHVSGAGKVNAASIATTDSADATITIDEVTLAKALTELKVSKPKVKGVVIQDSSETTTKIISSKQSLDKDKEFDEEQRLAREKAQKELEANIALIETWDDVQAKIDADYQMAKRLQKQKADDDKETAELKKLIEIIPNEEEVAIDAISLAVKFLKIIDWKIHKEGKKSYYQIIRADGHSKMYLVFNQMLKEFDREDLYIMVKAKYGPPRPVEDLDFLL
nr:hypothetical protein [Tanacetum cinerariifolium]